MFLLLEVYDIWDDDVDLDKDNLSDRSKRAMMNEFDEVERENKRRLFAYGIMTIHNRDRTLRYGNYDVTLFRPPINRLKRLIKDQLKEKTIKITI